VKNGTSWTTTGAARIAQGQKRRKYTKVAVDNHAELLPFSVETYGGMAPDAIKLLSAMGDMGEEQLGMWPRHVVIRHLIGSVATAVQRGNAVTWLSGYSRALTALAQAREEGGEPVDKQTRAVESEFEDTEEQEEELLLTEE
jgi:hypothetical protein